MRLGPDRNTKAGGGGREGEILGRRRVVEWKLKRRKAFLPGPVLPEDCCVVIEWTDATRAVATSMGDWKKGGQWGEWALLAVR